MSQDPLNTIIFFTIFSVLGLWFAFQSQKGEMPKNGTSFLTLFSRRFTSSDEKSPTGIVLGFVMFIVGAIMIIRQVI